MSELRIDSSRPAITRGLLRGKTPAELAKVYNRGTCYKVYNELVASGALPRKDGVDYTSLANAAGDAADSKDDELFMVDADGNERPPVIKQGGNMPLTISSDSIAKGKTGAEEVSFPGEPTLPYEAVERIRGILGIQARPKVLSMPMPEMLYPAMVIAVTELHFPPMRPEDFIDTVIYQWLEGCGYIPRAYIKKSELEKLIQKPTEDERNTEFKEWAKQRGLVSVDTLVASLAKRLNVPVETILNLYGDGDGNGHNGEHVADIIPVAKVEMVKQEDTGEKQPVVVDTPHDTIVPQSEPPVNKVEPAPAPAPVKFFSTPVKFADELAIRKEIGKMTVGQLLANLGAIQKEKEVGNATPVS